jgi:glycosyltransferase involved in cell wall biosynthesis
MNTKRRKRIGIDLLLLSQFSHTGIVTYTEWIVPHLIERLQKEYEWILFTKSEKFLKFDYRRYPNVRIKVTPWMKSPWLWKLAGVSLEARLEHLDLLFIPVSRAPLLKSCPVIVYLHDLGFVKHPEYLARGTVQRTAFAVKHAALTADLILTNSQFTKQEIRSAYGVSESKIAVTYLGFSQEKFHPEPARNSEVNGLLKRYGIQPPYVLYVGVIQGRKNLARLIRAAEYWRAKDPRLQLVLAGKSGWKCGEIYALASKFSHDEVVLTGPVAADNELRILYQMAECFVLPSVYEGFGIPVVEAMACGTPVILSRAACLPEIGGNAAFYFDPEKPEEIAERVLQVRTSPDLRERMIKAGIARAAEFTWDSCILRTVQAFEAILSDDRRKPEGEHVDPRGTAIDYLRVR